MPFCGLSLHSEFQIKLLSIQVIELDRVKIRTMHAMSLDYCRLDRQKFRWNAILIVYRFHTTFINLFSNWFTYEFKLYTIIAYLSFKYVYICEENIQVIKFEVIFCFSFFVTSHQKPFSASRRLLSPEVGHQITIIMHFKLHLKFKLMKCALINQTKVLEHQTKCWLSERIGITFHNNNSNLLFFLPFL